MADDFDTFLPGPTATAGALIEYLSTLPKDRPITVSTPDADGWLNIDGVHNDPDEQSAILITRDDFDTRQWKV